MSRVKGLAIAVQTADVAGLRVARSLLGVAQVIAEAARNVRVNKDVAIALSRRVDELVTVISAELETRLLSDDWEQMLDRFKEVLDDVQSHLDSQQQRSYLSQILYQERDATRLSDLAQAVDQAFSAFMVEAHMRTQDMVENVNSPLTSSPVLERLDRHMKDLKQSPNDEEGPKTFNALPPRPAFYFGRAQETNAVVEAVLRTDPAYVAILGGPGIGKTSLALTVLHDQAVERHFRANRFFQPCDGAQGPSGALTVILAAFGLRGTKQKALEQKLTAVLWTGPSLLVLDNFESAWEAPENRAHAEQVLQILSRIPGLSLILTLRGAERPTGVAWTRPFLPSLAPLSAEAGRHVFYSVSGMDDDQTPVDVLLEQTENVPLAIVLLANLAQYESFSVLMRRWDELKTTMLTRGDVPHRLSSLDVSISLSLHSPRMVSVSDAAPLLSLLALLPDGVMDTDVRLWGKDFMIALSTLLQSSLAYRTSSGRVRVLTPIREFMLFHHAPDGTRASPVFDQYFRLADQLLHADTPSAEQGAIASITLEIRNIESVIRFGLDRGDESITRPAIEAAIKICTLFDFTGLGSPDVLQQALSAARAASMRDLVAHLLRVWAGLCSKTAVPGDTPALLREALAIYESLGDDDGVVDSTVMLEPYQEPAPAIQSCTAMLELAARRGDRHRMARCHQRLAQAYQRSGDTDASRLSLERALSTMLSAEAPDYGIVGLYLVRLAENDLDAGRVTLGVSRLREALPMLHASHNTLRIGDAEHLLGSALLDQGDAKGAIEHLELALASVRVGGYFTPQVMCLTRLIRAHISACNEAEAADTIAATDALIRSTPGDWKYSRCELLRAHGEIALYRGDVVEARAALLAARAESLGNDPVAVPEYMRYLYAGVLEYLGKAALLDQCIEDARNDLLCSAILFSKLDYRTPTVISLCSLVQAVDDDVAAPLLAAIMLPVHRFGYRRLAGELLLHSANLASRQGRARLAAHRALGAAAYFEITNDARGRHRASAFLDSL